ncbi:MAG: TolC family protein [Acidobacteriota bacterium]
MKKRTFVAAVLGLALLGLLSFGQDKKELPLTLEDSIAKALKNNLNVAVEVISPGLAGETLSQAKEYYMPTFGLNYGDSRDETPATWYLQSSDLLTSKVRNYGLSVSQQIPMGGSLAVSLASYKSDSNQSYMLINPYYSSTLQFTFTQPLLRNFGWKVSRRSIIIAQNNLGISRSQFKSTLIETVYSVETAYWNLVYANENLKALQQSLELGRDLLTKTKKEVEVGQKAPIEVLNAEASVASREAGILQAEALVKRSRDRLKVLLNLDADPAVKGQTIVPADKPVFKPLVISYDEALQKAMARRPDLESVKYNIDTKKIDFTVAKNRLLPQLDLELGKSSPGISGTTLDPDTGLPTGAAVGSFRTSLRDAFKFKYNNWSVALALTIPLGDMVGRANYAYAKLDLEQTQARLKNEEQQIALEVSDAVLTLETAAKSVDAYRIARELAEKQLEAEMKKLNVGLSTNYFVLQYQNDLANARSNELKALVDYNIAVAKISQVTGTTLETRNISLTDYIK